MGAERRRPWTALRLLPKALAAVVALPPAYLLAALAAALLPANRDFTPTALESGGVPVYLRTNGVHADLLLPARAPHDWTGEFPVAAVVDLQRGSAETFEWVAFGWGDREFYLTTPTWRDLRLGTAWRALTGQGRGAMHVEYVAQPEVFTVLRLDVSPSQYAALVAYVRSGFARDATGGVLRIEHPGFGATDRFYEGTGRYSLWLTSNDWVRRGLAQAGIRTAAWSPFDRPLFWQAAAAVRKYQTGRIRSDDGGGQVGSAKPARSARVVHSGDPG